MNVNESLVPQLLTAWASHLPAIIAFIAALIVIMVRWQQAPRPSLFALLGTLLGLFMAITMPAIYVWLPQLLMKNSSGNYGESVGRAFLLLNIVGSVLYAVSFLLIFSAVYMGRRKDGV